MYKFLNQQNNFFFLNRKDVYYSNYTSPAKPEGLLAGAHAAVKQGCSTRNIKIIYLRFTKSSSNYKIEVTRI
jgi:hypothetical protein